MTVVQWVRLLVSGLPFFAGVAVAQPAVGSLVVGSATHLFGVDFDTGRVDTLKSTGWNAVLGQDRNLGLVGAQGDAVQRMNLVGTVSTIAILPNGAVTRAIATDQVLDAYVFATSKGVYRLQGTSVSTLTTLVKPNAICRDRTTGHYLAGSLGGRVWLIHAVSGAVTTVRSDLPDITGLAYLPSSGGYVVGRRSAANGVLLLDAAFNTVKTFSVGRVEDVVVDERIDRIFAISSGAGAAVSRIRPQGRVEGAVLLPLYLYSGITIWRGRPVTVDSTGAPGTTASVHLRFAGTTNAAYCVALSTASNPGLALPGGQFLGLRPDDLFFATACSGVPGLTTGFSGTLTFGAAVATFAIPAEAIAGQVLHVSAAVVAPGAPGGLIVGNNDSVQIR